MMWFLLFHAMDELQSINNSLIRNNGHLSMLQSFK